MARWCGQTEHVLVTIDTDFHTRWVKSGLLASHGVEVIVFAEDLKGLIEQHLQVTRHYQPWQVALTLNPYGHRVWLQHSRKLDPVLLVGKRSRRRSREPKSAPTV